MIHPLLLVGDDLDNWKFEISDAFQHIFAPSNVPYLEQKPFTKDVIRLGLGKYIVTFNTSTTMLISLFHNLYYDTARIVIAPDIYFEISIADVTKHRYEIPSQFKTEGPYKKCVKPFILYKKDIPREFSCELNEVKTEIYSVPL